MGIIYQKIGLIRRHWSVQDVQTVLIFLDFYPERKQNSIMTAGKEVACQNKIWGIIETGHGDNVLEDRTHTAWLGYLTCTDHVYFHVFSLRQITKCNNDASERGSDVQKVGRIYETGHGDNLLQYRIHTA
jgi:hypothetical protein